MIVLIILFLCFMNEKKKKKRIHCDFYSSAPWLWFSTTPQQQVLFALDPDFTGNTLQLYTYFTLILIVCYSRFDSHSFENANQTRFMWLLQVQTSVYIPVWVFIVRFNASLWQIWENFLLGVGDMCARRGVKTQPCDGTAYSASHSPHL